MAPERKAQILDAFEECILEFGFRKSSLQRIADHAGVQRTLIAHYFGKRQNLVEALIERILEGWNTSYYETMAQVPPGQELDVHIDLLFGNDRAPSRQERLFESLSYAAGDDQHLNRVLFEVVTGWQNDHAQLLAHFWPDAEPDSHRAAAYSLLTLSFGHWTLRSLGFDEERGDDVRESARRLLDQTFGPLSPRTPDS